MGSKKWEQIAKEMPGRTGRQCRDRYQNYLIPGFFNGQWSKTEDDLLLKLYVQHGSQWSKMAQFFKNRSANALKNRWNYFVSRHMTDFINFDKVQADTNFNNIKVENPEDKVANYDENNDDESNSSDDIIYENVIYYANSMDFMFFETINDNDDLNCKDYLHEFPYISNDIVQKFRLLDKNIFRFNRLKMFKIHSFIYILNMQNIV